VNPPTIIAIFLSLAIFAIQGVVPCGVCSVEPCGEVITESCCGQCQTSHQELPVEDSCKCESLDELPLFWQTDKSESLDKVILIEQKSAQSELPEGFPYDTLIRIERPPPWWSDWQATYTVFLI